MYVHGLISPSSLCLCSSIGATRKHARTHVLADNPVRFVCCSLLFFALSDVVEVQSLC